jgi:hypothetical protein
MFCLEFDIVCRRWNTRSFIQDAIDRGRRDVLALGRAALSNGSVHSPMSALPQVADVTADPCTYGEQLILEGVTLLRVQISSSSCALYGGSLSSDKTRMWHFVIFHFE